MISIFGNTNNSDVAPEIAKQPLSIVYNEDCVKAMKQYADNTFDLAIVDPPYGIGAEIGSNRGTQKKFSHRKGDKWDSAPPSHEYFKELFRVTKKQIIFGANHFSHLIPPSPHFCVWDKELRGRAFSDCEIAFIYNVVGFGISNGRVFRFNPTIEASKAKSRQEFHMIKTHPTQKPIQLYDWLLSKYANRGDLILDTHLGSGTHRISADRLGYDFVGFETDKGYFEAQNERFEKYKQQQKLF